jgi:hypothetical protein
MEDQFKKIKTQAGVLYVRVTAFHNDISLHLMSDLEDRSLQHLFIHGEHSNEFKDTINEFLPKDKIKPSTKHFNQGYICALATLIRSHGIDTPICEAWQANRVTKAELEKFEIDDFEALG